MGTFYPANNGYNTTNGAYPANRAVSDAYPTTGQPPLYNPTNASLPAKPDSFERYEKTKATNAPIKRKEKQPHLPTIVAPAVQPKGLSTGVAVLGGLALLVTGGVGTYFAGKHLDWFKAGQSASTAVATTVKEVLPKEMEAVFEKLGLSKDAKIEDIVPMMEKLKADINALKTGNAKTVADSESNIKNLEAQLVASKNTNGDVGALNADKAKLEQDLAKEKQALQQALEAHQAALGNHQQTILEKEQALATLQTEVERLTGALAEKDQYVKQIEQKTTENDEALAKVQADMRRLQAHLQLPSEPTASVAASQPKNSATQQAGKISEPPNARRTTKASIAQTLAGLSATERALVEDFGTFATETKKSFPEFVREQNGIRVDITQEAGNRKHSVTGSANPLTLTNHSSGDLCYIESREGKYIVPNMRATLSSKLIEELYNFSEATASELGEGWKAGKIFVVKPAVVSKNGDVMTQQEKGILAHVDELPADFKAKWKPTPEAPPKITMVAGKGLSAIEQKIVDGFATDAEQFIKNHNGVGVRETNNSITAEMSGSKNPPVLEDSGRHSSYFKVRIKDETYLVPSHNLKLNKFSLPSCGNLYELPANALEAIQKTDPVKIILVKPAKLNSEGKLLEKGEIRFE
jgi:hypothetical protein